MFTFSPIYTLYIVHTIMVQNNHFRNLTNPDKAITRIVFFIYSECYKL